MEVKKAVANKTYDSVIVIYGRIYQKHKLFGGDYSGVGRLFTEC